jgi:hypothetical protein
MVLICQWHKLRNSKHMLKMHNAITRFWVMGYKTYDLLIYASSTTLFLASITTKTGSKIPTIKLIFLKKITGTN